MAARPIFSINLPSLGTNRLPDKTISFYTVSDFHTVRNILISTLDSFFVSGSFPRCSK